MSLQAMVLKYRNTKHGPEAVVIVEVAKKGGHKGVFFVQRSALREGLTEYQILTFDARESAEACFGNQEHPEPAHQMHTSDKALLELIKRSIGDPPGKAPGVMVAEESTSIVGVCFLVRC